MLSRTTTVLKLAAISRDAVDLGRRTPAAASLIARLHGLVDAAMRLFLIPTK
jgi:hypothetical protein